MLGVVLSIKCLLRMYFIKCSAAILTCKLQVTSERLSEHQGDHGGHWCMAQGLALWAILDISAGVGPMGHRAVL